MYNNRKATSEINLPHYGLDGVVGHSLVRLHQARQFGITHWARTPILVHKGPEILKKLKISITYMYKGFNAKNIVNEH